MILAIDIGGTKVAMGSYDCQGDQLRETHLSRHHTEAAASLLHMIEAHFGGRIPPLRGIAIGVAGPVHGRYVSLTNVAWSIDADAIAAAVKAPVHLLNDLQALGYAVPHLPDTHLITIQQGEPGPGPRVLIAAGTGLGEAVLVPQGPRYTVLPSEGGHATFAPVTQRDLELARFLQQRYQGHVSWERVVSGQCGFRNMFDYMRERGDPVSPALLDAVGDRLDIGAAIISAADRGESIAQNLLKWFAELYGAEAGNMALKLLATGGVYIGGGIAPRILPYLSGGDFVAGFRAKGRFLEILDAMPIKVITEAHAPLLGAAHFAASNSP
ncbi:MAG: ROK family protein [Deltaproteobacteria bacterium]|nr:ROK family protein [Deltaproteobacteria bacterium]